MLTTANKNDLYLKTALSSNFLCSPLFMLLAIPFFFQFLNKKLLSSGFLVFLPASSRWRRTILVLMWTSACIKFFCDQASSSLHTFTVCNGCLGTVSVFRKRSNATTLHRCDICHRKLQKFQYIRLSTSSEYYHLGAETKSQKVGP